jgi:hypothetical protein
VNSRAALVIAVLAGFLLAVASLGLAVGFGVRYGLAHARPQAFENAVRGILLDAVRLGRQLDSVTTDFAAFKRHACEPRVRLVEVPPWRPPRAADSVARPVSGRPAP